MLFDADIIDYHNLFNVAEQEISIFTGSNDMEYADEFIKAACSFSAIRGSCLKIACQCGQRMDQCEILKAILSAPGRQGEIMVYDAHDFLGEPYFILADETAYRVEIPALAETILDYDDQNEIFRLHARFQHILQVSSLTAHALPLSETN